MALGERFTRSAVACEFSFLPVLADGSGDAFCDPRRPVAGRRVLRGMDGRRCGLRGSSQSDTGAEPRSADPPKIKNDD